MKKNYAQEKSTLKLAMAQMLVEGGNKEANLNRAVERIVEAAKNGVDLVLLPEAMDLGWTHSSAKIQAKPIPSGSTFQILAKAAKDNQVYVCAGIVEKDGDRTFNSAVLINRKGELVLKHRKINELDIAHDVYDQGDRINVCETEFGTIGLLICADATAKDYMLTRSLGYLGADLILLPSSWAVEADHDNNKNPYGGLWRNAFMPVCKEFNLNIAAVSNVGDIIDGPWKGWYCIGNSIFMSNNAENTSVLPYGKNADTIHYQDVVLMERPARGTSWYGYWSTLNDNN
ncbi:MAG: carbon-nitrogen hydrolase family protein [Mariniphaga sp.]|nr:carbon-nitrogen hydrolase family protein [Mariniphaga sp.]